MDFGFFTDKLWYFALAVSLFGMLARAFAVFRMTMQERLGKKPANNPLAFMSLVPTALGVFFSFTISSDPTQSRVNFASGLTMIAICMAAYFVAIQIMRTKLPD